MTRVEKIADHLREQGPATSKEIAAHFGWKYGTASAVVAHARAYGYIEASGNRPTSATSCEFIWRARPRPFHAGGMART
jgi:Mn-dependent DtxR family transcriptional regulator